MSCRGSFCPITCGYRRMRGHWNDTWFDVRFILNKSDEKYENAKSK